jgi:hypothetical protein
VLIAVVVLPLVVYEAAFRSWCIYRHSLLWAAGGAFYVRRGVEGDRRLAVLDDPATPGWIFLGGADVDGGNIAILDCYRGLRVLDLSGTKVTPSALESLHGVSVDTLRLRGVRLGDTAGGFLENFPSVRGLDLSNTGATDRIGPSIARLRNLTFELDLSGTDVSDGIIPYVETLPGLPRVNLSGTRVTQSGVDRLRRVMMVDYRATGAGAAAADR